MKKRKPASIIKNCKFCGQTVGSEYSEPRCNIKISNELNPPIQDLIYEISTEMTSSAKQDFNVNDAWYSLKPIVAIVERGIIYHNHLPNNSYIERLVEIIGCPKTCSERE